MCFVAKIGIRMAKMSFRAKTIVTLNYKKLLPQNANAHIFLFGNRMMGISQHALYTTIAQVDTLPIAFGVEGFAKYAPLTKQYRKKSPCKRNQNKCKLQYLKNFCVNLRLVYLQKLTIGI